MHPPVLSQPHADEGLFPPRPVFKSGEVTAQSNAQTPTQGYKKDTKTRKSASTEGTLE